ncbi:MAG: sigma-70 family RNA polymerase sigma factor [Gemmatimonadota bacterium]
MTDAELIARLQATDVPAEREPAEREFYTRHVDRVYRLILRMSGRADLAQEWTQDTFIRAFQRIAQFRGDSALSSWLHAIAVSITLNGLRTLKRREAYAAPMEEAAGVGRWQQQCEPDLRDCMKKAIDALPMGTRTVFVMHDVEGYTHEEISAAMGVAVGTSKSQLFRAREKLRVALAPFARKELA